MRTSIYKAIDTGHMGADESIKTQGIISPLIVRPIENTDEYEVVSGHRRLHAAIKAGLSEVPALIYPLDRNEAMIAVVDSNHHRERILPSEKAFAYKMKMEAMKAQGKRTDLTLSQATKVDVAPPKSAKRRTRAVTKCSDISVLRTLSQNCLTKLTRE